MPTTTNAEEPWTPYGLEAYRVALLRRRNRLITLGLLLGLALMAGILLSSIKESNLITTHNSDGSSVTIQVPEQPRAKPLTLSISPGKTTVLERPIQPEARPKNNAPAPNGSGAGGLNWANLLASLAPPLLAALAAAKYARKRATGPLEQVNLGVYKGAMPFEMISAQHKKSIFTPRQAYRSLFGKGREEHVPATKPVVQRAATALILLRK